MRSTLVLALACLGAALGAACSRAPQTIKLAAGPPVAVSPLPSPTLPAWIAQISPTGRADQSAQIRVRFAGDLVPVEELSAAGRAALLDAFTLEPAMPGRFVIYTPRLVAYETDAALPLATRFRVTLRKGLQDLAGHRLAADLAWTFETAPIEISGLPAQEEGTQAPVVGLTPELRISSNAPLELAGLSAHAELVPESPSSAAPVPLRAGEPSASPSPSPADQNDAEGERQEPAFAYVLTPAASLRAGTTYRAVVHAGVPSTTGNVPSTQTFDGALRVRGPLAFTSVETYERPVESGGFGRFTGGAPQLDFTNPLDANSARTAVHLSPAPRGPVVEASDGDSWIRIGSTGLAPHTHYTITVDASLRDAFGQSLNAAPVSTTFDTSGLAADLWAPTGTNIFPADRNLQLNVYSTNLPEASVQAAFRTLQPTDLIDSDSPAPADQQPSLAPSASTFRALSVAAHKDAQVVTSVALRKQLGAAEGMLAYGIRGRTNQYREGNGKLVWANPSFYGLVGLTNLGVFAQWFPHAGRVVVNHLADGSPAAGAQVAVYESLVDASQRQAGATREPCATGTTDASGTLQLNGVAFASCAATATSATEAPSLLVVAREGSDWASVRTWAWSGGYDDGLNGGWSAGAPDPRGVIASDRSLYQPGETAYFAGLAYFVTDGVLGRGRSAKFALTLESPSGAMRNIGNATLDEFGAFAVTLPLARNQELGYYTLHAKGSKGEALDGSFRVAEFKPPNFKVALTLDRATAPQGTSVHALAQSDYLFGAPVAGVQAQITVTRQRTYFTPVGWESWDFGRVWMYPDEEPSVSADVLQRSATVGANGSLAFEVPVGNDLPFAMAYRVDAQTTDVANVAVSDSKTFTALPSDALIGLSADFVGTARAALPIKIVVVDPSGKPLAGHRVHVALDRRTFARATQIVEGGETPHESVEYSAVDQADAVSSGDPQTVTLTPREPGEYRVRANFSGAKGDASATDHVLWVAGPGQADWGSASDNHIALKLDKSSYRPGDVATAVVASPYAEAELDFAVIRAGVLYHQRSIVHGAAPRVQFRIDEKMLPNASVEALLVRRGPPLSKGIPPGLGQLARIGFAAFTTALDSKVVKVTLSAASGKAAPGSHQSVRVVLKDGAGRPVRGEVALMVVNDAVLQLTGYRPPDLVKTVYAEQSISTRYADSRTDVVLTSPARPAEKGYGFGGGLLAGSGETRIRTNFKPVAYFNGAVRTGADGSAHVAFTLPDDLTTWRMLALAFTTDARFGNGEGTFITTKPLITNPMLPQFARPGDTLQGGVSVTNTTAAGGTLHVAGNLSGGLAFVNGTATSQTASLDATAQALGAYRFGMLVTSPTDGRVQFASSLGANSDAFAVPLLVHTTDVLESVVQTGATQDRAGVPLDVGASTPDDAGGLDVQLASSIVPNVAEPVRRALADDSSFSWSVVGRSDVAADALLLARTYQQPQDSSLLRALSSALGVLASLRAADGGVAEWPGTSASDPFLDASAYTALAHARQAGADAAAAQLTRLHPALLRTLANPGVHDGYKREPSRSEVRLATLAALAENGEVRSDFVGEIVAQTDHLSVAERFTLARLLQRLPAWKQKAGELAASLQQLIAETGRSAAVITSYAGAEEQAAALRLFVAMHAPTDLVDRTLASMLGLQRDGTWGCGCADALALDALVAYSSLQSTPPNFSGTLSVGPVFTRSFAFSGYRTTQADFALPMRSLPRGKSDVAIEKKGNGTLRFVVAYRYRVTGDAPGRYQGLRLDRIVRAAGADAPVATFGLGSGSTLRVKPAQVFEIEDRIVTDHPVDRVTLVDPLPAGMEAVDATFLTSSQAVQARTDNWEIDYQQIYADRVEAFASHLNPGVYAMHYLVRTITPGTFAWPAGEVHLERAPEEFGRTAMGTLTVASN